MYAGWLERLFFPVVVIVFDGAAAATCCRNVFLENALWKNVLENDPTRRSLFYFILFFVDPKTGEGPGSTERPLAPGTPRSAHLCEVGHARRLQGVVSGVQEAHGRDAFNDHEVGWQPTKARDLCTVVQQGMSKFTHVCLFVLVLVCVFGQKKCVWSNSGLCWAFFFFLQWATRPTRSFCAKNLLPPFFFPRFFFFKVDNGEDNFYVSFSSQVKGRAWLFSPL